MRDKAITAPVSVKVVVTNLVAIIMLLVTPFIASSISEKYSKPQPKNYKLLTDIKEWKYTKFKHLQSDAPVIHFADHAEEGVYQLGKSKIDTYVYVYSSAVDGKEIIHHNNLLFDKKYWTMIKKKTVTHEYNNKSFVINEYLLSRGNNTRIVRYFYLVNGRYTTTGYMVKLYELFAKLLGQNMDSRLIVLSTNNNNDYTDSGKILNRFTTNLFENLKL